MRHLLTNLLLALLWAAMSGRITIWSLFLGYLIGMFVLWLPTRKERRPPYFRKVWKALGFAGFFLKELTVASLRVAQDVVTPRILMRPAVLAVPLDARSDFEITLVANLVSLTPGTLSVDVSRDRRFLYVHAMFVDDPDRMRRKIKTGFERRVLELTR